MTIVVVDDGSTDGAAFAIAADSGSGAASRRRGSCWTGATNRGEARVLGQRGTRRLRAGSTWAGGPDSQKGPTEVTQSAHC